MSMIIYQFPAIHLLIEITQVEVKWNHLRIV
jgi:hypothetical protein